MGGNDAENKRQTTYKARQGKTKGAEGGVWGISKLFCNKVAREEDKVLWSVILLMWWKLTKVRIFTWIYLVVVFVMMIADLVVSAPWRRRGSWRDPTEQLIEVGTSCWCFILEGYQLVPSDS
jgi:hypothetical protein